MKEKPEISAEKTDWKVTVTLDREGLRRDIAQLEAVLADKRNWCIVSAADDAEAHVEAMKHFETIQEIPRKYVLKLRTRRLPTDD
jgi:hypothetical protein